MDKSKEEYERLCAAFPNQDDRLSAVMAFMFEEMGFTVIQVYTPLGEEGPVAAMHLAKDQDILLDSLAKLTPVKH